MERFENWMSYSFDDVEFGIKTLNTKKFQIHFNRKIKGPLPTFKEALYNNARLMRDCYSEPFDVCLSGGTDSEVMVRVFKDLKINHNTYIFRLEDNLNCIDVQNAVELCQQLNLPYHIIDFNMKKFFENEVVDYFDRFLTGCVLSLPRLKWLEYLDNIPVIGNGEPYWKRELEADYSQKSKWIYDMGENEYIYSIAARRINRTVIGDWYEFTPEVLLSSIHVPYVASLLNDQIPGKHSNRSSKALMFNHIWPDIKLKPKLIGYEGYGAQGSFPEYINEFKTYVETHFPNTEFWYSVEELENFLIERN
jgi:hypothetical protein